MSNFILLYMILLHSKRVLVLLLVGRENGAVKNLSTTNLLQVSHVAWSVCLSSLSVLLPNFHENLPITF